MRRIIIDIDKGDTQSNEEILEMFVVQCSYMELVHEVQTLRKKIN